MCHRVARFEGGEDALPLGEQVERGQRLPVVDADVLRPARVAQERVLRADARVVEPGRDGVRVEDLAVLVGEDGRARAVQDAGAAGAEAPPVCSSQAIACEGSSAGTIPSSRESSRKARRASASVTAT